MTKPTKEQRETATFIARGHVCEDVIQAALIEDIVQALATEAQKAALEGWEPISTAPTDGSLTLVHADARDGLPAMECLCSYHPDAGWCADELREVTLWHPKVSAALNKAALEADARLAESDAAHAWIAGMLDAKGKKVSGKIMSKQLSDWRFEAIARHRARGAA